MKKKITTLGAFIALFFFIVFIAGIFTGNWYLLVGGFLGNLENIIKEVE